MSPVRLLFLSENPLESIYITQLSLWQVCKECRTALKTLSTFITLPLSTKNMFSFVTPLEKWENLQNREIDYIKDLSEALTLPYCIQNKRPLFESGFNKTHTPTVSRLLIDKYTNFYWEHCIFKLFMHAFCLSCPIFVVRNLCFRVYWNYIFIRSKHWRAESSYWRLQNFTELHYTGDFLLFFAQK